MLISIGMEAVGNPKIWVPYMNTKKDCSHRLCTEYCQQWCRKAASPPSISPDNDTRFPHLLITLLGVVFSCLLLVTYFAVMSNYCRKKSSDRRRGNNNRDEEMQATGDSLSHQLSDVGGLDESFIKSIVVCEYKKGDGFFEGTDCAVCLGEFLENECLRKLPKCGHCFHLQCIDVWLKSHSTCPLCRTNLVTRKQLHLPNPPPSLDVHTVTV